MIRIFHMRSKLFHCVFYLFDCQRRAILTKRIRSSPSLSPSHQFLRVTGTYIDFKGGTPGVEFCIIFTRIDHRRTSFKWNSKWTHPK